MDYRLTEPSKCFINLHEIKQKLSSIAYIVCLILYKMKVIQVKFPIRIIRKLRKFLVQNSGNQTSESDKTLSGRD